MSLSIPYRCIIPDCKYNQKPVYADKSQIKNHLLRDHDYQEKLEAALSLDLINNLSERRSPSWLSEKLADFSLVTGDV